MSTHATFPQQTLVGVINLMSSLMYYDVKFYSIKIMEKYSSVGTSMLDWVPYKTQQRAANCLRNRS